MSAATARLHARPQRAFVRCRQYESAVLEETPAQVLQEAPVPVVGRNDVEDDHGRIVLLDDGPDIQARADLGDVDDEDDKASRLDTHLEQLHEIGVGMNDGNNRRRTHAVRYRKAGAVSERGGSTFSLGRAE